MLDFMNEVFSRGNKMGVALNNELTRGDHEQSLSVSGASISTFSGTLRRTITVCVSALDSGANFHDFHRLKSGHKQVYSVGH